MNSLRERGGGVCSVKNVGWRGRDLVKACDYAVDTFLKTRVFIKMQMMYTHDPEIRYPLD